jgi:hypothetical protein
MSSGDQRPEFLSSDSIGKVLHAAGGTRCVTTNCPDTIYNPNPQVAGLLAAQDYDTCRQNGMFVENHGWGYIDGTSSCIDIESKWHPFTSQLDPTLTIIRTGRSPQCF